MYVALARRVPPSRQQSNHQLALCHRTSTACVSIGPARLWVRMVIMRTGTPRSGIVVPFPASGEMALTATRDSSDSVYVSWARRRPASSHYQLEFKQRAYTPWSASTLIALLSLEPAAIQTPTTAYLYALEIWTLNALSSYCSLSAVDAFACCRFLSRLSLSLFSVARV